MSRDTVAMGFETKSSAMKQAADAGYDEAERRGEKRAYAVCLAIVRAALSIKEAIRRIEEAMDE